MNNYLTIFISMLLLCSLPVSGQHTVITDIEQVAPPVLITRGMVVDVECDSIWLVSPFRLGLYEEARQLVMSLNTGNIESLISQYEHKLKLYSYWNDSLRESYRLLSYQYDSTLVKTTSQLSMVDERLSRVDNSILESKEQLDKAIQEVKRSRTDKWLWGLGGILVGLGVAAILR
ncbi:MAG TPA: hypothetical protein DCR43_09755 [Bacteroidales bacterium]|nr:MAG: hypothetical protein A2X09_06470 [Bacteroidetes bacterium GWF2_43_11]HAQ66119.1 hypothetical protein [Bacteroidales bacterium]